MIPVPFWKPTAATGNPNILLWVTFADSTATDISIYNRTPTTTITGGAATIIPNFFHINITSASPTAFTTKISYQIAPFFNPLNTPLTYEGFVKWVASADNTFPFYIFEFNPNPTGGDLREFGGYLDLGQVKYADIGGTLGPTGGNPLAPTGTLYHWAWVIPTIGDNHQYFYINGVNVLTLGATASSSFGLGPSADWAIGGQTATNGFSSHHTELYLGETRVSLANLYPGGSSFTPPTPGSLPPVP